jgi:hypothetical protein
MNITDIPVAVFDLYLPRTTKAKLSSVSKHFSPLRKPLEPYFILNNPTFIRLYINLLDTVKTKKQSKSVVDKAQTDYDNNIRNASILNILILHNLKKQSIYNIYKLYKEHLILVSKNDEEESIKKYFSITYEFAKLYVMMHFINNKTLKKNELEECLMTIVSSIEQKLQDERSYKHPYFKKLLIIFSYIRYYHLTTKNTRLYKFIEQSKILDLTNKTPKENYEYCIAFLLDPSNHKYF